MSKPIIEIEHISKRYRLGAQKERYLSLRDEIVNWVSPSIRRKRALNNMFWALNDVSFSVERGEAVGIIGRNGAGKSTLLKVLSQITPPTGGKITMRGRVASLLEVGTGFHPELTGRENVYLNGAILGMTRREIARKFDEIVAFAEVEKFLDTPVKRYSSGMYVRLAFAVAAYLEPEILVVDEVLAVGDGEFQKKCLGKMDNVAKSGRTVLFVSHNMAAIQNLCSRSILLRAGQVEADGNSAEVTALYIDDFLHDSKVSLADRTDRSGNGNVKLTSATLRNSDLAPISSAMSGASHYLDFGYVASGACKNIEIAFTIRDSRSQYLYRPSSEDSGLDVSHIPEQGILRCSIPRLPLVSGSYRITVEVKNNGIVADYIEGAYILNVECGDFYGTGKINTHSPVLLDHKWSLIDIWDDFKYKE